MSEKKYPWPEWALTAYALDELKPELTEQIRKAETSDAQLAAEIAALRATLDQVSTLFKNETQGIEATQFDATRATISETSPVSSASAASEIGTDRSIDNRFAIGKWVGLATLAASTFAAAYFLRPDLFHGVPRLESTMANISRTPRVNADWQAEYESGMSSMQSADSVSSSPATLNESTTTGLNLPDSPYDLSVDASSDAVHVPFSNGYDEAYTVVPPNAAQPAPYAPQGPGSGGMSGGPAPSSSKSLEKSYSPESKTALANVPDELRANVLGRESSVDRSRKKATNPTPSPGSGGGMGMGGMGGMEGGMGDMEGGGMGMGGMGMGGREAKQLSLGADAGMMGGMASADGYGGYDSEGSGLPMRHHENEDARRILPGQVPGNPYYGGGNDRYQAVPENEFLPVNEQPLSTFSIDVDSASYVKTRQFLMQSNQLPPPAAVRIEDFINYFDYEYAGPQGDDPFAANLAVANCPWQPSHKLVRIALQATKVDVRNRPRANIVFLLDVSGSMDQPNKLPLVKESMRMLIQQLGENDRVAMVVYAGAAGCVLDSTTGNQQELILGALDRLSAGGSTNGGQGIQLAYDLARDHFVPGGINRVILCTDGDFNVGVTNTDSLVNLVAQNAKSKIFLTVLGFGMGNTNDAMMEQISNKGNGLYGFVDSHREARRQMVQQLAGNLMTVAKDVKIQVEFNPQHVASYRLIGYENRKLENRDFADDKKDAGEIGAGHRVTALYEIVPVNANERAGQAEVDELRYAKKKAEPVAAPAPADDTPLNRELLVVKLRYKQPEGDTSKLSTFPLLNQSVEFNNADRDFQWAASMAQFGMLLRKSRFKGDATWNNLIRLVENAAGVSADANRQECIDMIRTAASLGGR